MGLMFTQMSYRLLGTMVPSYVQKTPAAALGMAFGAEGKIVDREFGGRGRIYGTVTNKGAPNYPVRRRVLLLRDFDGVCIAETWSDPITGAYEFKWIDQRQRYTVAAYDFTQSLRIVLADNLTPELL